MTVMSVENNIARNNRITYGKKITPTMLQTKNPFLTRISSTERITMKPFKCKEWNIDLEKM